MLEEHFEERLDALTKKVENLSNEVQTLKSEREEEVMLIPGAEYDFVPITPERVIARGVAKIVRVTKGPEDLGLSAWEWELLSADEDGHE
jgi:archaellum component FlaC